jgi:hypothetical protein
MEQFDFGTTEIGHLGPTTASPTFAPHQEAEVSWLYIKSERNALCYTTFKLSLATRLPFDPLPQARPEKWQLHQPQNHQVFWGTIASSPHPQASASRRYVSAQ